MENELDFKLTEDEIRWIKEEYKKRIIEQERCQRNLEGLALAYKNNYETYLKRLAEYNSLPPLKKLLTKIPIYS